MIAKSLKDRCRIYTNIDTDTFVGIKCVNGDFSVNFPLGFRLESDEEEKQIRKDILLLLNALSKNTTRKDSELNNTVSYVDVKLPIQAYLYVISDYYTRGYYKERETVYEVSKRGKISWGKTIKTQRAYIQDNELYYFDFVTKKRTASDNELITLIHEYCVYESFAKIGWIFSSYMPEKPRIKLNQKLFTGVIKKKIAETFNDRNKQLFHNMLAIVSSLGDDGDATDFKYGTYRFEYVWESMIDKAYGIRNKEEYFPKTKWILSGKEHENAALEPDTIMLTNDAVYVLDAKYYKFGWTKAPAHLPESTSINKQITYGEYIAETEKFKDKDGCTPTVYNAFIMPYDAFGKAFYTEEELHYIGSAVSDWKRTDGSKSYEQVAGILLDVKTLMKSHSHDEDKILKLASLIEEKINEK